MKKKTLNKVLGLSVAAMMTITSPAALWAADTEVKTEAGDSAEAGDSSETGDSANASDSAEGEKKTEDLKLSTATGDMTVKNESGHTFTKAELVKTEAKADGKKEEAGQEKAVQEDASKAQAEGLSLVLTEEGAVHTFEDVTPDEWKEAKVYDKYGFLYLSYKDENGKDQELLETAGEKEFEQPLTMYVSTNVHIRKEADKDSESLKILSLGDECQVTAAKPGWFKVKKDELTGYVYHSYITEDKASVDAAVKAQKEAEAAAAAAQAQAAAAAAQAAADAAANYVEPQAPAQEAPQEVYEVSRQAFDDCDGSGHGYYEITYSDGSVAYEDY